MINVMSVVLQILAVEILQHKFNIEKMMKILELLQAYTEDGETVGLQVSYCSFFLNISTHGQNATLCYIYNFFCLQSHP